MDVRGRGILQPVRQTEHELAAGLQAQPLLLQDIRQNGGERLNILEPQTPLPLAEETAEVRKRGAERGRIRVREAFWMMLRDMVVSSCCGELMARVPFRSPFTGCICSRQVCAKGPPRSIQY